MVWLSNPIQPPTVAASPATEMAAVLGLEADETTVRGGRRTESNAIPVQHCWKIVCREPGLRVDERVARIIERLAPHTAASAALASRLHAEDEESGAVLEVVPRTEPQTAVVAEDRRAGGSGP